MKRLGGVQIMVLVGAAAVAMAGCKKDNGETPPAVGSAIGSGAGSATGSAAMAGSADGSAAATGTPGSQMAPDATPGFVGRWAVTGVTDPDGPMAKQTVDDMGMKWELRADGTAMMSMKSDSDPIEIPSTWKSTGSNSFDMDQKGKVTQLTYKRDGDQLTLTVPAKSQTMTLTRIDDAGGGGGSTGGDSGSMISPNATPPIVGRWELTGLATKDGPMTKAVLAKQGKVIWQFNADKTLTMRVTGAERDTNDTATWTITDDEITMDQKGEVQKVKYYRDGTKLTLTAPGAVVMTFKLTRDQ